MSLAKSIGGKKVNFEFNKDFINIFTDKIKVSDINFINQTLKDLHPSDVANLIENLPSETRSKLIEIEEFNIDPEIFIEINESIRLPFSASFTIMLMIFFINYISNTICACSSIG